MDFGGIGVYMGASIAAHLNDQRYAWKLDESS